jgi:hypothetical protein
MSWLRKVACSLILAAWLLATPAFAQQDSRPSNTKIALTYIGAGILIALPVFVVCRSSRRGTFR